MSSTNIQIAIKVRPFIEREEREKLDPLWLVKENSIVQIDGLQNFMGEPYSFDHIFDDTKSNKDVYDAVVKPLVISCLEGINTTIFAYGQTSSGKTHTMLGDRNIPGIIKFAVEDIFGCIQENVTKNFLLRCSYLEIYNEKINDLLDTGATDIKIREDYSQGVYVRVQEEVIREPEELFNLMKRGMKTRKIGCTDMNERSSRSHTIFKLVIQSRSTDSEGSYTESTLNLVDLAGSERVGQMNMGRERQVEGVSINKSLTTLGLVIRKLSDNEPYINYRDSKLTRLLQHSLGGNSKTLIIATITVAASEETKSTLEFAQRAKYVKNRPIINERVTDKDQLKQYEHLCENYKEQIEQLRLETIERDKTINALEDKICNIKLFTAVNADKFVQPSRIPHRRHTLAYYKPQKKLFSLLDPGGVKDSSDTEETASITSPVKSEINVPFTSVDNKESSVLNDSICSSPYKRLFPKSPSLPGTPSTLKLEKELLEESYLNLLAFTNHGKQFQGQSNELEELRNLTEQLRNENFEMRQENLKRTEVFLKLKEDNKDVYNKLNVLKTILETEPFEEVRKQSLHTILEEDIELFNENLDLKYDALIEENNRLKEQISEKEVIIDELKNEIVTERTSTGVTNTVLEKEIEQLKTQINVKDTTIHKLKQDIKQDKDIKEAELEILNNKIKNLHDYKEEMHKKISDIQIAQETFLEQEDWPTLKLRNTSLQQDLQNLRRKHDALIQLAEYDSIKIGELEEEINTLKTWKSEKEFIISEKDSEIDTMKNTLDDLTSQIEQYRSAELKSNQNQEISKHISDELKLEELQCSLSNLKFHKIEENAEHLKDTCEYLQDEVRKLKELLEFKNAELAEKTDQYNTILTTNSEKTITIEILEKEMQELKIKLDEFSALPTVDDLQHLLAQRSKEIENLNEDKNELIKRLNDNTQTESRLLESAATFDDLKTEINELRNQLHSKIKAFDEKTDCYNELISKLDCKTIECECLMSDNNELRRELDSLSKLPRNDGEKYVSDMELELTRVRKEKEDLLKQLNCKSEDISTENERLKSELEDTLFQLSGEQKELENCCRQLDEKTQNISALERITLNLKKDREEQIQKLQELTNNNSILRADVTKKDEQLKELQEEMFKLREACTKDIDEKNKSLVQLPDNNISDDQKSEIAELKDQLYSRRSELDEKTDYYNTVKLENEGLLNRISSYLQDIQLLKTTCDDQTTEISQLKGHFNSKVMELDEITSAYDELVLNYDTKQKECQEMVAKTQALEKEKMQYLATNASLAQSINGYVKDIQILQTSLEEKSAEVKELVRKGKFNSKVMELDELTSAYDKLVLNYDTKQKECQDIIAKTRALEEEKMQHVATNASLAQSINGYVKEIQILQTSLEEKSAEVKELVRKGKFNSKVMELDEITSSYDQLVLNYDTKQKECQDIIAKTQALEEEKMQHVATNASLAQSINGYVKEIQILQTSLEEKSAEVKELKDELNSKIKELDETIGSYNELRSTCDTVQKERQKLESRNHCLSEENNRSKATIQSYLKDLQILQTSLEEKNAEVKELVRKGKSNSKVMELDELTSAYDQLVLNYDTKQKECQEMVGKIQALEEEKMQYLATNASLEQSINGYVKEIQILQTSLEEKSAEVKELVRKGKSNSKVMELDELTSAYDQLVLNYDTKQKECQEMVGKIQALEEEKMQYLATNASLAQSINGYVKEIQILQTSLKEKSAEVKELVRKGKSNSKVIELDELTSAYDEIVLNYDTKQKECQEMVAKTQALEEEKMQYLATNASLEQSINGYVKEIQILQTSLEEKSAEVKELVRKGKSNSKVIELDELTSAYDEIVLNYDTKQKECQEMVAKTQALEEEKMQYLATNASLEQSINGYVKEIQILQTSLEEKSAEVKELKDELNSKIKELDETIGSYNELRSTCDTVQKERQKLASKNHCLSEENNRSKATIQSYLKDLQILQTSLEEKNAEVKELKDELNSKIKELDETIGSYNELRSTSDTLQKERQELANKNNCLTEENNRLKATIESYLKDLQILQTLLEEKSAEVKELVRKGKSNSKVMELDELTSAYDELVLNYDTKQKECQDIAAKTQALEEEKMQHVATNASLAQSINGYVKEIQILQTSLEEKSAEVKELKDELNSKIKELDEIIGSYNELRSTSDTVQKERQELANRNHCLAEENNRLKATIESYLKDLQLLQTSLKERNTEIKELKEKLDSKLIELNEKTNSFDTLHANYNCKEKEYQQRLKEIEDLKEKNEELKKQLNTNFSLQQKENIPIKELKESLLDTERQLKDRCEDYLYIKGKCNSLEIQLLNYKDDLTVRTQELERERRKLAKLNVEVQNTEAKCKSLLEKDEELVLKTHQISQELEDARTEIKSKTVQLTRAQEELCRIKCEHEKCKLRFEQIQQKNESLVSEILQQKSILQEQLRKIENTSSNSQRLLKDESNNSEYLNRQLSDLKKRYNALESQFNVEKAEVSSLLEKVQNKDVEIVSLQAKINDLKKAKENQTDKNPVTRLSDESGRLSPNELRRNKRHSIHDRRRGLTDDSGNLEDDSLDSYCRELKKKVDMVVEQNNQLIVDMQHVRKKNEFLKSENENMKLQAFPARDRNEPSISCSECNNLKNQLSRIQKEVDDLKKENKFLYKKNENDLYEQLKKFESSTGTSVNSIQYSKMQTQISELRGRNAELQKALLRSRKVTDSYNDMRLENEKLQLKQDETPTDSRNSTRTEDKETQATCDLREKYNYLKKIALLRRREGNYLRSKLNLPPDCPVLPEDVQRQQPFKSSDV